MTLDFEIVKGRPAWEPISIQKIYDGLFRYGDPANSIENLLKPVDFTAAKDAAFARLRVVQTGHGMDKPDGCGKFCDKYRELWVDGKLFDKRPIWKQCGDNPLYPQAGTWVYSRANWCPGELMQPDLYNLPVLGGSRHTLDLTTAGAMLKDFESDFGSSVVYDFAVGQPVAPITAQTSFGLYPTSTNGPTTFDYYANFPEDLVVQLVTDPGNAVVEEHRYPQLKEGTFTYDLSRFPKGRFYLKVLVNGQEKFKKRIRLKER